MQYFNFILTPVGFHCEHILVNFEIYAAAAKNSYLNPFSFYICNVLYKSGPHLRRGNF